MTENSKKHAHTPSGPAVDNTRRRFLAGAAGMAGLALAPGVFLYQVAQARPAEQAASSAVRWGMLIDTAQCKNCDDCVKACNEENGLRSHNTPLTDPQWIRKVTVEDKQTGYAQEMPLLCLHCANPPCVDVCPTGASMKRADGIVLVDKHRCIGCRYCMMACPFKARSFVHEHLHDQIAHSPRGKGTVESCTFCVHRVDREETPACVEACSKENKSMLFGNMNDPDSEISKRLREFGGIELRSDLGLNLGVRYQGLG